MPTSQAKHGDSFTIDTGTLFGLYRVVGKYMGSDTRHVTKKFSRQPSILYIEAHEIWCDTAKI